MEGTRIPKIIFNTKPEGRRGVGRPKLRWVDDIEADIRRLKAQDRKEWTDILREAKTKLKKP
jgi:hypothetical protein